jgi:hypothetical protein
MKKRSLMLMAICLFALSIISRGQDKQSASIPGVLTSLQMKANWEKFSKDPGFSALLKEVREKGFLQVPNDNASWGFEGDLVDAAGKDQPVTFCAYDFYNPKSTKGQGCSMIWKKVGDRFYKAYLVFPEGEKNTSEALKGSMEWYVDENAKVQRAHSWNTCFQKCVQTNGSAPGIDIDISKGRVKVGGSTFTINCSTGCFTGAIVCSGIAAGAAFLGQPHFAIAALLVCAGGTCAPCLALCALGCM